MSVYVEAAAVDRTSVTRFGTLQIERTLGSIGLCRAVAQSLDASWRPAARDFLEIWDKDRQVTDAAITADDATLTSASASFTSADVGRYVRVAGAGVDTQLSSGATAFYAKIASLTSGTSVELDDNAIATVSGATCLIGVCRFGGPIIELEESRCGGVALNTREFSIAAEDLVAALATFFPTTTHSAESIHDRLDALINTDEVLNHGIRLFWPITIPDVTALFEDGDDILFENGDTLLFETGDSDGGDVAAVTYDGHTSLQTIFDDLCAEEAASRNWSMEPSGRVRFDVLGTVSTPQALTTSDFRLGSVKKRYFRNAYRNQQVVYYGPGLTDVVTVAATFLLQKNVYNVVDDEDILTHADAVARANALLAQFGSTFYLLPNAIILIDGFEPGQQGSVTISEHDISTTLLIQSVITRHIGSASVLWEYEITATNAGVRTKVWQDYYRPVE